MPPPHQPAGSAGSIRATALLKDCSKVIVQSPSCVRPDSAHCNSAMTRQEIKILIRDTLCQLPAFIQNMTDGDVAACQFDHGL
jgi:hypothetical protein